MELVIMRHGQTAYNIEHRYTGCIDAPLTDMGRQQARDAGCATHVGIVYVSSLQRAQETARICFPNARQIVRPDLREMDFGGFQGKTAAEMEHDPAYRAWVDSYCALPCPGGESQPAFIDRVSAAVRAAVAEQAAAGAQRTIIVAHGGAIMAALSALARPKEARGYFDWRSGNCCGYRADVTWLQAGRQPGPGSAQDRPEPAPEPSARPGQSFEGRFSEQIQLCNIRHFSKLDFLK